MKMKIKTLAVIVFLLTGITSLLAQDKYGDKPEECKMNLSLFHESVKAKNFKEAIEPWKSCFDNCPKASIYIYTDGLKIAKDKIAKGDASGVEMVNTIYAQRIENYPTTNLGKVYSDWAKFLITQKAPESEIFEKLELAYKSDPAGMSAKNIFRYFQKITDKYKDTDVQLIFNTMDDVIDAVNKKINKYTSEYTNLNTKIENGEELSKKEKSRVKSKFYEINLSGLGKIEGGLNGIVNDLMTCERLIPLYRKNYELHKTDAVWLKRAAVKLNKKGCDNDALYVDIVESWAQADQSVNVWKYLEKIYRKQGRIAEADALGEKIFNMGTPMDKANFVYSQASDLSKRGKLSQARKKAREALSYVPSYGKAYLLIASMYAKSANSVGTDELSKRMVYVAAANKARQAMRANPSLTSRAKKYIKSYSAQFPSKTLLFNKNLKSGASHKVGGWIGETVRIP